MKETQRATNNVVAFLLGLGLALSLFGCRSLAGIVLGQSDVGGSGLDPFGCALFDRFLFALFPLLLFGRLCDLDNDATAVELLLVQELCSLFGSLEGVEGDEAVTSRALAAVDDLSGKAGTQSAPGNRKRQREGVDGAGCQKVGNSDNSHIGGNGSEKGLEAIVGGAVREVTSEYLQPLGQPSS